MSKKIKKYTTPDEISAAFIRKGWKNPVFEEVTREQGRSYGFFINKYMDEGHKFFRMVSTGNIFDDTGSIVYYKCADACDFPKLAPLT